MKFKRSLFGFNPKSIDTYIEELELDYHIQLRERDREILKLQAQVNNATLELKSSLAEAEMKAQNEIQEIIKRHNTITETLTAENDRLVNLVENLNEKLAEYDQVAKSKNYSNQDAEMLLKVTQNAQQLASENTALRKELETFKSNIALNSVSKQQKINDVLLNPDAKMLVALVKRAIKLTAENDLLKKELEVLTSSQDTPPPNNKGRANLKMIK